MIFSEPHVNSPLDKSISSLQANTERAKLQARIAPKEMTMTESSPTPTLPERIAAAMADVRTIPQRGENKYSHYHYATADDVYDALRPILARHGLTVWQKIHGMREFDHNGVTFLIMDVATGLDGEDPDTILPTPVPLSTASSKGVKLDAQAIQAGLTYAQKYYLRSRFLLATGDPDADADAPQIVDASTQPKAASRRKQVTQRREETAKLSYRIDGLAILDETTGEVLTEAVPDRPEWNKAHASALYRCLHKHASTNDDDVPNVLRHNEMLIIKGVPYRGRLALGPIWKTNETTPPELIERLVAESTAVPGEAEG